MAKNSKRKKSLMLKEENSKKERKRTKKAELEKMSEDELKKKKKKQYKCECGKHYFSYAALYTHIKIKHNDNKSLGIKTALKKNVPEKSLERASAGRPEGYRLDPEIKAETNNDMVEAKDYLSIFMLGLLENEEIEKILCNIMETYSQYILGREEEKLKPTHVKIALESVKKSLETAKGAKLTAKINELLDNIEKETSCEISDENYDANNSKLFTYDSLEWKVYRLISFFRTFLKENVFEFSVKLVLLKYDNDFSDEENINVEDFEKTMKDFVKKYNEVKKSRHTKKKAYENIEEKFAECILTMYKILKDVKFFSEFQAKQN